MHELKISFKCIRNLIILRMEGLDEPIRCETPIAAFWLKHLISLKDGETPLSFEAFKLAFPELKGHEVKICGVAYRLDWDVKHESRYLNDSTWRLTLFQGFPDGRDASFQTGNGEVEIRLTTSFEGHDEGIFLIVNQKELSFLHTVVRMFPSECSRLIS